MNTGLNARDILVETAAVAMLRRKGDRNWRQVRLVEVVDECGGGEFRHWLTQHGNTALRALVPKVKSVEDVTLGDLVEQAQKA